MRKRPPFKILIVMAAVAGWPGGGAEADQAQQALESSDRRVPARATADGLLVVPVAVNGTGPHAFVLDTGATSSIVDEALAADLSLPGAGTANRVSPNGARPVPLAWATLRLGGVEWTGDVLRAPLDAVRAMAGDVRGVVGQDLLRNVNWWIDPRRAVVIADAEGSLSSAPLGERLPVHWRSGRPAIDALLPDRRALRLVIDTGATAPLLFREPAPGTRVGTALLESHEGESTVPVFTVGPLQAGGSRIPAFAAGVVENERHRGEDGLLPAALFDGVYFDNRNGTVVLNPRRSALRRLLASVYVGAEAPPR